MKKLLFTVGFLIVFGVFVFNVNSNHVSAAEIDPQKVDSKVTDPQEIDFKNAKNGQIIESTVLENGVIREIIKISDDPNANVMMPMGAGVWDLIGDDVFISRSKTVYSHGGDFKLVIHQAKYTSGVLYMYKLVEESPLLDIAVDNFTGPKSVGTFEVVYRGIDGWVDGKNGTAELHLEKLTYPFDDVYVQFWD